MADLRAAGGRAGAEAFGAEQVAQLLAADDDAPALVLASTDGYVNSFADDAGFLKVGSDLLAMIRSEGLDQVGIQLEGWLGEVSELGSGDDVSLGLLVPVE